jgi:hypothetical protein
MKNKSNHVRSRPDVNVAVAACLGAALATLYLTRAGPAVPRHGQDDNSRGGGTTISVAFLGNSMFYFNDFPRFFEEISGGSVVQDSCLHGGASIGSLLLEGNLMHPQFKTAEAVLGADDGGNTLYDYGACTVPQLLLGRDDRLDDPGYPTPGTDPINANPCRVDGAYRGYAIAKFDDGGYVPRGRGWDYVLVNDNTRNPARRSTRAHALQTLERFYVPWLLETGSVPVFLWTHAYVPDYACGGGAARAGAAPDMTGLGDVANFTSLTRVGYQAYADLLRLHLPAAQAPRIAPVGLAYLVVHEENRELWKSLFHCDNLHASPSGSFLQGCVVHHALFGRMPDRRVALGEDAASLWKRARMMQHAREPPNPFPDAATAEYLYGVAERVAVGGYVPKSFVNYQNGEMVDS